MSVFEWIAVGLVVVLSAARLTRLATYDKFPPVLWLRTKYEDATDGTGWQMLAFCPYCASPWITLVVAGSGWASGWHAAWWFINGVFAASYLAAMVMVHDGEPEESEPETEVSY